MLPRQESEREQEEIADQKPIDRLPHHHRVLADVDEQQQHQLAGEQHRRARRGDDAERQGDIEDAREVGFEKVHDAERAEKGANADAVPRPEQGGKHGEIDQRVGGEQQRIDSGIGGELGGERRRKLGHCRAYSGEHARIPKANTRGTVLPAVG